MCERHYNLWSSLGKGGEAEKMFLASEWFYGLTEAITIPVSVQRNACPQAAP